MEHLIYDNYAILTDDNDKELKESLSERRDIPIEDITEEMLQDERNDMTEMYFQDELDNLDQELEGRIIAIADLGLYHQFYNPILYQSTILNLLLQ